MTISRSKMLAGMTAALAVPYVARAATPAPVHVAAALSESSANAYYASELGFFKQQGLDAKVELFATSGLFSGAVASSTFDIGGVDTGTVVAAHARGVPFVALANGGMYNAEAPNTMLCVAKDSAVHTAADFEGKAIGVTALNNINQIALCEWLTKGGANYKNVNMIEVPSSVMPTALTTGRVAGALVGEPYLTQSADVMRALAGVGGALSGEFMLAVWSSSKTWYDANRDTAKKFTAAINQASAWAIKNPKEADLIFARYVKMPIALAERIHHVRWSLAPATTLLQPVIDIYAKYAQIPKAYPASELLAGA